MNSHQERLSRQISFADSEILDITAQRTALEDELAMIRQRITFLNARQNNWVAQRVSWQIELGEPTVARCVQLVIPEPRLAPVIELHTPAPLATNE